MPNIGAEALVLSYTGAQCLIWSAADCARVRSIGRLCVSPIGLCSAKLATRGKAAAVPVVLNDEELWVCCAVATHWRVTVLDMRTGRAVPAASILGAAAAADRSGFIHVRRLVFADLWQRGYRCTSGLKFGCDYLSYTADASQVHAAFMVIVRRERDDGADGGGAGGEISPLDLVAKSRVATTALKICVMAYGDTRTGRVRYAAFKRMGPGSAVFRAASALLQRSAADAGGDEAARGAGASAASASTGAAAAIDCDDAALDDAALVSESLSFLPEAEAASLAGLL